MNKAVMLSIRPKWCEKIASGEKTIEVRKTRPNSPPPFEAYISQYAPAINPSNPEADVYQEHMDRVLAEIINGRQGLIPFAERYPELKKIKYER